jgi:hypothetical protein
MFGNMMLRRISGPKRQEVKEVERKLRAEGLFDL